MNDQPMMRGERLHGAGRRLIAAVPMLLFTHQALGQPLPPQPAPAPQPSITTQPAPQPSSAPQPTPQPTSAPQPAPVPQPSITTQPTPQPSSVPQPAPAAAQPSTAPQPGPTAAQRPTSFVSIVTTDPDVWLERRIGSLTRNPLLATGTPGPGQAPPAYYQSASYGPYWESDWERVCATPCRTQVPAGGEYRIGGQGVTPSDSFAIRSGQMQLDVSPGSSSARGLGTYMTVFGFLLAAAGGVFLAISAASDEEESADADKVGIIVSTAGLAGGALIGGVGIVLMVVQTTDVRDERGKQIGAGSLPTLNAIGHF